MKKTDFNCLIWFATCLPIVLFSLIANAQADWGLKQLVSGWSKINLVEAQYVGLQSSVFFDEPVESKGKLTYKAPDQLQREILAPIKETLRIDGDQLYIKKIELNEKKGEYIEEQQYTISSHQQLATAISAIKAFMAGDIDKLDDFFITSFSGSKDEWSLVLNPIGQELQKKYQKIQMQGQDLKLLKLTTVSLDDEETVLNIVYNRFE